MIICGNCIDVIDIFKDNIFDGVITSPPYNLGNNPRHSKDKSLYSNFSDNKSVDEYINDIVQLFNKLDRIIKEKGIILWNMGISTKNAILPQLLLSTLHYKTIWSIGDVIYWKKKTAMPFQTSSNKASPYIEPIYVITRKSDVKDFIANKKKGKINERTGQQFYMSISNIFEASNGKSTKFNKATFSDSLVKELIDRYFIEKSIILDPFVGSGTTLKACNDKKIYSVGIEISKEQFLDFKGKEGYIIDPKKNKKYKIKV